MRTAVASFLLMLGLVAIGPAGHAQAPPRTLLFFVDDLHMDFRTTPAVRQLLQRLGRDLERDGDLWTMVTPGYSSVAVGARGDWTAFAQAVSRVTNGGIRREQRAGQDVSEVLHRARVAASTAAAAIQRGTAGGGLMVMLYVSSGYARDVAAETQAVVDAATERTVPIFVIDPGPVTTTLPPGMSQTDWDAEVAVRHESLRPLAQSTGGLTAFTDAELEAMIVRLRASSSGR
jgi:hypothetical protein